MGKGGFGKIPTEEELQAIQEEHNFGGEKKFLDYVQGLGYDRSFARKWFKENRPPPDAQAKTRNEQRYKYGQPIFNTRQGGWQFDTVVPSKKQRKNGEPYQLFFVNNNTREVKSFPMPYKNAASVSKAMDQFFDSVAKDGQKVSSLTSDQDKAYQTESFYKKLASKGVDYHTTVRENHHALGVLNRAVHTIRHKGWVHDQNAKGKGGYSDENWQKYIDAYNNEKHKGTGITPNEMKKDPNKEIDYIAEKMNESDEKRAISKEGLEPGKYVRLFTDPNMNKDLNTGEAEDSKNKKNLEPDTYQIQELDGAHVWLRGKEPNNFIRAPRYLILADPTMVNPKNLAEIKMPSGDVDHIEEFKKGKYLTFFTDGSKRELTWRQLREGRPLTETRAEKVYWNDVNNTMKKTTMKTRNAPKEQSGGITSNTLREEKDELPIWKDYE